MSDCPNHDGFMCLHALTRFSDASCFRESIVWLLLLNWCVSGGEQVLGDRDEFARVVKWLSNNLSFDKDVRV